MRIVWNKKAYERFLQVSAWYVENMGQQAAEKFERDTLATVELLSRQPGIRMLDERRSSGDKNITSIISHSVSLYRGYFICCSHSRYTHERISGPCIAHGIRSLLL